MKKEEMNNLKVCLVTYTGQVSMDWISLGVAFLSAVLKKNNYSVTVMDFDSNKGLNFEDTKDFDVSDFDIIGFSVKAGKSLSFHLHHIERIKSLNKTVIVGGSLVTTMPEMFLNETKADFIIIGEGEEVIINLLNALKEKKNLKSISGLGYRYKDKIIINPPIIIKDIDKLPMPDYEAFDMKKYLIDNHSEYGKDNINMFTSRGCPFDCKFCSHTFGRKWRGQSAKRIVKEMQYLKKTYRVKRIYFQDDNFMFSKDRVLEFCKLVKPLNIKWICEARADNIKEDIVRKMKESGCVFIRIGLESGSNEMLKAMNKGLTLEHSRKAISVFRKLRMPVRAGFIIGMPTETIEYAKETLKFMKEIYKFCPNAHLWTYYYTPRPDTVWYWLAVKKGMKEYTLKDWSKLDKYEQGFFNLSNTTEKQVKLMILKTGLCSLFYGKGMLQEYIFSVIKRIRKGG